jgi:hypothetical protein
MTIQISICQLYFHYTVKPAQVVTSFKQSPVLKGQIIENFISNDPLKRPPVLKGHCLCPKGDLLI